MKHVMKNMERIEEMKEGQKWKDVDKECNKFCFLPFVHCLWECSELNHKCEDVCFDGLVAWALEENIYMDLKKVKWNGQEV